MTTKSDSSRQDKRRQIMAAAEKLFTKGRFHEITLDDVVHAAGVGKGTVYRYFKDKDDLFFQTAAAGFDCLQELIESNVPADAPFDQQLPSACRQIGAFYERRKQLFRMMQSEGDRMQGRRREFRRRWRQGREKVLAALTGVIARGVAEGRIRKDISAEVLAQFLLGMLRTRARDLADAPAPTRRHEILIDLFRHGAEAASSAKGNR